MEIYQLRAFATAARLGNLTRTAEALHRTQPAITAQIKALKRNWAWRCSSAGPAVSR